MGCTGEGCQRSKFSELYMLERLLCTAKLEHSIELQLITHLVIAGTLNVPCLRRHWGQCIHS